MPKCLISHPVLFIFTKSTMSSSTDNKTNAANSVVAKGKAKAAPKVKVEKTAAPDAADVTTDNTTGTSEEKKGGRSIFLKVAGETCVHHTLFKDLLTIGSKREGADTSSLTLGFRDGRELSAIVENSELAKTTKRMKEYSKNDNEDTSEQRGRSTFLKIHNETYVHHSLFADLLTIASDKMEDGNFSLQLSFRDGRSVITDVEQPELQRVVKRVKEFVKRLLKAEHASAETVETDTDTGENVKASNGKKKEKTAAVKVEDGPVSATLS